METHVLQEFTRQINEAVAALIEMEAMKAQNMARENEGLSPVYSEIHFRSILDTYSFGYNENIEKMRRFY